MKINNYSFGFIQIDEKDFDSDVIIYPDGRIQNSWWRKEGHRLSADDITDLIESKPELIIVGTGAYGCMNVDSSLDNFLRERGIELAAAPSAEAVELFNKNKSAKKTGACFHLTC